MANVALELGIYGVVGLVCGVTLRHVSTDAVIDFFILRYQPQNRTVLPVRYKFLAEIGCHKARVFLCDSG